MDKPARPQKPPVKFNAAYICSFDFLLKLAEIILLLVTVVLASKFEGPPSIIYIQIVSALGAATCTAWVILFIINLNARFPDFFPVLMLVYHLILAFLTIGVGVNCGVLWPQFKMSVSPHYAISTIMSFIAGILFIVDTMLNVLWWRGAVDEIKVFPCSPWQYEPTI